jgi:hypothetical protein
MGGLHVPPAVRPVHDMEDVGRGNDGEVNDLASLSFGSGTEYLAETYVGPRKKGRFDQRSSSRHMGGLHVPPAVRPVHDMEDVGRGNDGEVNDLASLSFGSGTEYLAEIYILIDSKVEQNGSLATYRLFRDTVSGSEKDSMALIKFCCCS